MVQTERGCRRFAFAFAIYNSPKPERQRQRKLYKDYSSSSEARWRRSRRRPTIIQPGTFFSGMMKVLLLEHHSARCRGWRLRVRHSVNNAHRTVKLYRKPLYQLLSRGNSPVCNPIFPRVHLPHFLYEIVATPSPFPTAPPRKQWYDKVADALLGDDDQTPSAATSRYALICEKCFAHNGLVKESVWEDARKSCPLLSRNAFAHQYHSRICLSQMQSFQPLGSLQETAKLRFPRYLPSCIPICSRVAASAQGTPRDTECLG